MKISNSTNTVIHADFEHDASSARGLTLTYFLIRLSSDGKTQPQKPQNIFYQQKRYAFCRTAFTTKILSENPTSFLAVSLCFLSATEQPLQYHRRDVGVSLSNLSGDWTDRSKLSFKTERCVPLSYRPSRLSQSDNIATFPVTDGPVSTIEAQKATRQTALGYDSETSSAYADYLRLGLNRPYSLWQTGDGSHRIQSRKTRQTIVSSTPLFQRRHQGLLAWATPSRRCSYRYRNNRTPYRFFCQIASLGKERNYQGRQGFLRPQDHRVSGIQETLFCHCGEAYITHQKKTIRPALPKIFIRHRGRRIHVSAKQLEKRVSIYRDTTSNTGRPYRRTYSFLNRQIQLSDHRNKHATHSSQHMEVLQWPSLGRTYYQRTQRGLPLSKDPDKTFCSKRGVFSYPFIFLQSHKLVQTAVSAKGVSSYDA